MSNAKKKLIIINIDDYAPLENTSHNIEVRGIQKDGPIVERAAQYAIMVEKKGVWNTIYKYLVNEENNNRISNLQLNYNVFALDWMCYFTRGGKEILLMHPVMGAPAAECLVQQAHTIGCDTFIRLGTTGSLNFGIPLYSVITTLAAVRNDATSDYYLSRGFPAIASSNLSQELITFLRKEKLSVRSGVSYTTATRFRENLEDLFKLNKDLGVLNIDMESAAVFATATALNMRSASISLVTDCLASENDTKEIEGSLKGVPIYDSYFSIGMPKILKMFEAVLNVIKDDKHEHTRYFNVKKEIDNALKV